MNKPTHLGRRGEAIAASLLKTNGFIMEAINWRAGRLGEIDIVATLPNERLLVFVEVKTRRGNNYGAPIEAITPRKQAQITALAEAYLAQNPQLVEHTIRFDVITIQFTAPNKPADIVHLENAFSS